MAETDELIGAEKYFISNVRDLDTAQRFLMQVERFKERAFIHGHSAEGNPSGGNKFRGLYNIVLKSCGAAMKRNPDVRLDYVIEYSERTLTIAFTVATMIVWHGLIPSGSDASPRLLLYG